LTVFPAYFFGDILYWAHFLQCDSPIIDWHENYIKQSQRNHTVILGPNASQKLSVPIVKPSRENRSTGQIKIEQPDAFGSFGFKKEHLHSLKTAYSSSPFFESLFPKLESMYQLEWGNLQNLHLLTFNLIAEILDFENEIDYATEYVRAKNEMIDLRVKSQNDQIIIPSYQQVFSKKHGFVPHLSILDLIFNEGKWSRDYLLKISPL